MLIFQNVLNWRDGTVIEKQLILIIIGQYSIKSTCIEWLMKNNYRENQLLCYDICV